MKPLNQYVQSAGRAVVRLLFAPELAKRRGLIVTVTISLGLNLLFHLHPNLFTREFMAATIELGSGIQVLRDGDWSAIRRNPTRSAIVVFVYFSIVVAALVAAAKSQFHEATLLDVIGGGIFVSYKFATSKDGKSKVLPR